MITSFDLLSNSECDSVVGRIHDLRPYWIPRCGAEPCAFFTLGAASYMDDRASLARLKSLYNPLLCGQFGELLERVRAALGRLVAEPARFEDALALPGFHIWQAPAIFTEPDASIHFDVQYRRIEWPPELRPDFERSLSFTLPISLPKLGGGLIYWDLSYDRYRDQCERAGCWIDTREIIGDAVGTRHPYTPGVLVTHSGHVLHQIAPVSSVDPDDERITLQGHAVRCERQWILYW
jgi:hypothetical protein